MRETEQPVRMFSRKTKAAFAAAFILMALTIALSLRFADRKYYLTSVLVLLYAMLPFFVLFEHRKPQPKELVTIAVMSAIAIVSRVLFVWLPNFKPMAGILMITGMVLGPEAGFLTGAVSALVSNFFFGQGPWTPWQMFAMGMTGFMPGLLAQKGILSRKRVPLCIFGGLFYLCLIGPLLDTCTLFTMTTEVTKESAAAVYLSGLPVNVSQAAATVLTLALLSGPLSDKLGRVKKKYGMMETQSAADAERSGQGRCT